MFKKFLAAFVFVLATSVFAQLSAQSSKAPENASCASLQIERENLNARVQKSQCERPKYIEGYACPLSIQLLCFESSLSMGDWANWSAAIGTILAVLSTIYIGDRQHKAADKVAKDNIEAMHKLEDKKKNEATVNALLAATGYFNALADYSCRLHELTKEKGSRHKAYMYMQPQMAPVDPIELRSIGFFVMEDELEIYSKFTEISIWDLRWQHAQSEFSSFKKKTAKLGDDLNQEKYWVREIDKILFEDLIAVEQYIVFIRSRVEHRGWKIPEMHREPWMAA